MNEEHPRLFIEHMAVDRGHLDVAGSARISGLTSVPVTRKSPVMAAFPPPGAGS
jgi:hypothetical protein